MNKELTRPIMFGGSDGAARSMVRSLAIFLCCCLVVRSQDENLIEYPNFVSSSITLTNNLTNETRGDEWTIVTYPASLLDLEWKRGPTVLSVNITNSPATVQITGVQVVIDNENTAMIREPTSIGVIDNPNKEYIARNSSRISITGHSNLTFSVEPVQLGRAKLDILVMYTIHHAGKSDATNGSVLHRKLIRTLNVSVVRPKRLIDTIFQFGVYIMLMIVTLTTGAEIDLTTVKGVLKKPKAPLIALFSQFVLMPLLAYAIVRFEGYRGGTALGFFTLGCAPGGGPSNMYAHLLGGDLSVSITMTLLSTVLSVATLPFWLYTLGTTFPSDGAEITIPFMVIFQTMAVLIVPLAIGILIQYKLPKVAEVLKKSLKVIMGIVVLFLFVFGIISNLYIFEMFDLKIVCIGAMLPYGGFLLGAGLAFAFRCDWTLIKTISIETGLQNSGIPFFMIQAAFSSPDVELATIPVISAIIMTPIPLLLATFLYLLYNKCKNKVTTLSVDSVESATFSDTATSGDGKITSSRELLPLNQDNSLMIDINSEKPPEYSTIPLLTEPRQ